MKEFRALTTISFITNYHRNLLVSHSFQLHDDRQPHHNVLLPMVEDTARMAFTSPTFLGRSL